MAPESNLAIAILVLDHPVYDDPEHDRPLVQLTILHYIPDFFLRKTMKITIKNTTLYYHLILLH